MGNVVTVSFGSVPSRRLCDLDREVRLIGLKLRSGDKEQMLSVELGRLSAALKKDAAALSNDNADASFSVAKRLIYYAGYLESLL